MTRSEKFFWVFGRWTAMGCVVAIGIAVALALCPTDTLRRFGMKVFEFRDFFPLLGVSVFGTAIVGFGLGTMSDDPEPNPPKVVPENVSDDVAKQ
jgi:hypothetical protein